MGLDITIQDIAEIIHNYLKITETEVPSVEWFASAIEEKYDKEKTKCWVCDDGTSEPNIYESAHWDHGYAFDDVHSAYCYNCGRKIEEDKC